MELDLPTSAVFMIMLIHEHIDAGEIIACSPSMPSATAQPALGSDRQESALDNPSSTSLSSVRHYDGSHAE